jgi:hypothetical protein
MVGDDLVEEVEGTILRHDPHVTTGAQLSRELDASKPKVLEALRILQYNGAVESVETGANAVAWWHTERVTPAPPEHPAEHPAQEGFHETADRVAGDVQEEIDNDVLTGLEDHVRHELPTRGKSDEDVDAMVEAVRAAAEYILEFGDAGAEELKESLYEDHSGPYGSPLSWYNNAVKPGLKAAVDADDLGIVPPESSGQKWRTER